MKHLAFRLLIVLLLALMPLVSRAQGCSMCTATAQQGEESGLAGGINNGILFLVMFPYLLVGAIAFFWYRNYRRRRRANH